MTADLSMIEAWRQAGRVLGIEVVAPFHLVAGGRHDCVAFLPCFGGGAGMLVKSTSPPSFDTDPAFVEAAERAGYRWTFLNRTLYESFDAELFTSTLRDWGYTGPPQSRPAWLG